MLPEEPEKDGFVFDGWYKEKEFINKWDTETDVYNKADDIATVKLYARFLAENQE